MSREQREARNRATCRHFNGLQGNACSAAVNYEEVTKNNGRPGIYKRLPCWGGFDEPEATQCNQYSPYTQEEIEAREKEISDLIKLMGKARESIISTGQQVGEVECPKCKGSLKFSVASNGHVHAGCKCGLGWVE